MSPPREKVSSCGNAIFQCDGSKRVKFCYSFVVIVYGVFSLFVFILLCCFACWTYFHIVELQAELSTCRCHRQGEKWREQQVFEQEEPRSLPAGQRSPGTWPGTLTTRKVFTADEDLGGIHDVMTFHGYRSSNTSNHETLPRLRRDDDGDKTKRRRCRRKGRRQKAQPHVHYEAAGYSVVNVAGTVPFWQLSDWFSPEGCWFVLKDGHVRVKEAGVYWVYAQVTFDDEKDTVRSQVLLGGRGDRPPTPILTCDGRVQNTTVPAGRSTRACFVAGIKRLDRNDRISVEAWGGVKASPDYTYFGLLKLGT